jgi:hypothetical protein
MTEPREARLWQVLGFAFVTGGSVLLAVDVQNFLRTRTLDSEGLKIGIFCSFAVLAGLAALNAWRIFRNMEHPPADHFGIIFHLLARIGTPLGAILFEYGWARTMSMPTTNNQKALLLAGGFIFLAGLISLISERVIAHMHELAEFHAEYAPSARRAPDGAHTANAN